MIKTSCRGGLTLGRVGDLRACVFIVCALLCITTLPAHGKIPYQSYTYNFWREAVPAPISYVPQQIVDGPALGISRLREPQGLFIVGQTMYVADTGNHRIVVISAETMEAKVIDHFFHGGERQEFRNPRGIFVSEQGIIAVADTGNQRIVVLDKNLETSLTIDQETLRNATLGDILPKDFSFLPRSLTMSGGQLYVISSNVYEGLMVFTLEGQFRGFIGAPRVAPTVADVLWSRFATEEQRQRQQLFLPTDLASVRVDARGFLLAVDRQRSGTELVKRYTLSGRDVLMRQGVAPPQGDLISWGRDQFTMLVDIAPYEHGIYSILDGQRGRVFTYDERGNLLYVFGGRGNQEGLFQAPAALAYLGHQIVVLDRGAHRLTIFQPTEYAQAIVAAIAEYNAGRYQAASMQWAEVLRHNSNDDLAYTGLGMAMRRQEQYLEAMQYFRLAQNRGLYSEAFANHRRATIEEYFSYILFLLFFLVFLVRVILPWLVRWHYRRRAPIAAAQELRPTPWQKTWSALLYAFHVIFHPFDGFWDIKHERRGNVFAATVILLAVAVAFLFSRQYMGFIFNERNLSQLNIYIELSNVFIPFALWCIVNWSLTTLMGGKGSVSDIYIASAYALTPLVLIYIPTTILSNFLIFEEGTFVYMFLTLAVVWSLLLLFLASMITHEYDGLQTLYTSALTIVGIGIVVFIALLFVALINDVGQFLSDIYMELSFRL